MLYGVRNNDEGKCQYMFSTKAIKIIFQLVIA